MAEEKSLVEQVGGLVAQDRSMIDVESSRAVAEVQGAMAIAKRFHRDENAAYARIMKSCQRRSLAERAIYEYPRGGEKITGPSIRLAEAVAQGWGNIATGVVEVERRDGESLARAYCVDLETNYRKDIIFMVPHTRDTKSGKKNLTDSRDIYETIMNSGSRRLRNCIMAIVPGDIFDEAVIACEKTLVKGAEPLVDRIRSMLVAFGDLGVTNDMIEKKFGIKSSALSERQIVRLRGMYQSIKDGVGEVAEFFGEESAAKELSAKVKQDSKPQEPAPAVAKPKEEAKPGDFGSEEGSHLFPSQDPRMVK